MIHEWASRHGIGRDALTELYGILQPSNPASGGDATSEADVQARLRVTAAVNMNALWRNNNGAVQTEDGRHVRFGLGNDSHRLNKRWKSSDLIGITRMQATEVGQIFGVFTAIECKRPSWSGIENERDRAQQSFMMTVKGLGGLAGFATQEGDYKRIIYGDR